MHGVVLQNRVFQVRGAMFHVKPFPPARRSLAMFHVKHRYRKSSRKCFITVFKGLDAACPSPQIDASPIACASSVKSASSHLGCDISFTAFSVPTRQGVHWPQDSSSKNRIRLIAASFMLS